jgi:hypothetical protein
MAIEQNPAPDQGTGEGATPEEPPEAQRSFASALLADLNQVGAGVITGVATAGALHAIEKGRDKLRGSRPPDEPASHETVTDPGAQPGTGPR